MHEKNAFTKDDYLELDQFMDSLEQGFPHTDETIRSGLSLRAKLEGITRPSLSVDTVTDDLYLAYQLIKNDTRADLSNRVDTPALMSFLENVRLYLIHFQTSSYR